MHISLTMHAALRPPILVIEWRAALQLVAPRLIVCKIVGGNQLEAVVVLVCHCQRNE